MTKKNRTGLQSKISHIFAGVPIPKKSRPVPKPDKPESESDAYELSLAKEDEPHVEEKEIQESPEEQPMPLQSQDEEQLIMEPSEEPLREVKDKGKEDVAAEEQIQEPSVDEQKQELKETVAKQDTPISLPKEPEVDKPVVEEPVLEIQDEGSTEQEPVIEQKPELKETVAKQVKPIPKPKEPAIDEPVVEEPVMEIPVDVPPVKEPVIEKPAAPIGSKFDVTEIDEPVETQKKPPLSRTLKADIAQTKKMQAARKVPKRLKSKSITKKPATNPTKQKTMIALVIVLSIVLVMLLVKPFSRFSQNTGGSTGVAVNVSQVPTVSNFQAIKIDWPEPPVYNSAILRDPMELGQATKESKQLTVKGISSVGGKRLATIGIKNYGVGDEVIPGVKIIEMTEDYVKFERDGETWTQNVGE